MIGLHLAALVSGGGLGGLFVVIWRRFAPAEQAAAFWRGLYAATRGVLGSEEVEAMWRHYKALLGLVAVYTGRNLLGIAAAIVPVALFLYFIAPMGLMLRAEAAPYLEVVPAAAAARLEGTAAATADGDGAGEGRALLAPPAGAVALEVGDGRVAIDDPLGRHAFCAGGGCGLFAGLGFSVHELEAATLETAIVLRPSHGDINPLWPYLSDLELIFVVAFCLASFAAFFRHRGRG